MAEELKTIAPNVQSQTLDTTRIADQAAIAAKADIGATMTKPIYPTPSVIGVPRISPPTAQTVYSAPNITQAITAPVKAPNLNDPYGLYDSFMSTPEILAAQQQVAQGQQAINQAQGALRTTTRALEGQNIGAMGGTGASVNLIGRQVGRARQLTADELAGLGEAQQAAIANLATLRETGAQRYQIAQQERAQLQDLIRQTGGKAGISFTDSYESALQKADKYQKEVAKQEAKDKKKEALKTALLEAGLKTKGSTKELEKRYAKYIKESGKSKKEMDELELALKRKELAKPYYKDSEDKVPTTFNDTEQRRLINEALAAGENWQQIYETFDALGIDTAKDSTMDKYLKQKFGY